MLQRSIAFSWIRIRHFYSGKYIYKGLFNAHRSHTFDCLLQLSGLLPLPARKEATILKARILLVEDVLIDHSLTNQGSLQITNLLPLLKRFLSHLMRELSYLWKGQEGQRTVDCLINRNPQFRRQAEGRFGKALRDGSDEGRVCGCPDEMFVQQIKNIGDQLIVGFGIRGKFVLQKFEQSEKINICELISEDVFQQDLDGFLIGQAIFRESGQAVNMQGEAESLYLLSLERIGTIVHKFLIEEADHSCQFVVGIAREEAINADGHHPINRGSLNEVLNAVDVSVLLTSHSLQEIEDRLLELPRIREHFIHHFYSYDYKSSPQDRPRRGENREGKGAGRSSSQV